MIKNCEVFCLQRLMDLFKRERDLCLLFKSRHENNETKIGFFISNNSVDIAVFHRENKWDFEKGRLEIDQLWKDFNLAFIGYKPNCSVIRYKHDSGAFVTEYMFPMIFFNIDNFHSPEF